MKESEIISLKKKVEALSRLVEYLLNEVENTKVMAVGVYQTIKEMPGYSEAIAVITEKVKNEKEERGKVLTDMM